jgi:hypothetical protein
MPARRTPGHGSVRRTGGTFPRRVAASVHLWPNVVLNLAPTSPTAAASSRNHPSARGRPHHALKALSAIAVSGSPCDDLRRGGAASGPGDLACADLPSSNTVGRMAKPDPPPTRSIGTAVLIHGCWGNPDDWLFVRRPSKLPASGWRPPISRATNHLRQRSMTTYSWS